MSYLLAQADAAHVPLATASVDLVLGSPPYIDCRLYLEDGEDLGIARDTVSWVRWMMDVSREAVRVSRGAVLWVVSGKTDERNYQPGPEGLIWEWFKSGGCQECPCYWHRVGICGSGGDQWFRKDVEYILAFKHNPKLPWSHNTANGEPPKYGPGGEMSHRVKDGHRRNQWGQHENNKKSQRRSDGTYQEAARPSHVYLNHMKGSVHEANGDAEVQGYAAPTIANPGNYLQTQEGDPSEWPSSAIHTTTGGGQLGWSGAHENEAPYPQALAEWFIRSLCPPGGIVADFFSGSGTTVRAAEALGRHGIGFDLRRSQCELGRMGLDRPHKPIVKQSRKNISKSAPLFDCITD